MDRNYDISELGPSLEAGHYLSKVSYRVGMIEGNKSTVVEVRIPDALNRCRAYRFFSSFVFCSTLFNRRSISLS